MLTWETTVTISARLVIGFVGLVLVGCHSRDDSQVELLRELPDSLSGFRQDAWFLPDDSLLGFVEIPAGPFLMGSAPSIDGQAFDNERWSAERAQGTVDLETFFIGRFEVTTAQFLAYVKETEARVNDAALNTTLDHPVSSVSWPDALAYCRWLDQALRNWTETPATLRRYLERGWRVTLPSEAEWEKAARGTDGRIYSWGNELTNNVANFNTEGTRPVGAIDCPTCLFGLHDMSGNVWELTRSQYRAYPFVDDHSAVDLQTDALFVMRGGSFTDQANTIRSSVRGGTDPGVRRPFIGFRISLSPFTPD